MSYHDLSECTLTADERLAEAWRILELFGTMGTDGATERELEFIEDMQDAKFCSTKQLFWLRDIKDKLL